MTYYQDPGGGTPGVGGPGSNPKGDYVPQTYDPKYFPYGGGINPRDFDPNWRGMDPGYFEQTPGAINAPMGGAYGAYQDLARSAPTPGEDEARRWLGMVDPNKGLGESSAAYSAMMKGADPGSAEYWLADKTKKFYDNAGYTAAEKADISNAEASALNSQVGAAKDEMYRRAARSGNPMATYNAMANAGQGSSAAFADMERKNRIAFADKLRADQVTALGQLAPTSIAAEADRRKTGAAGGMAAAGQGFGQGMSYADALLGLEKARQARMASGASGLAGLYGIDTGAEQSAYELLAKLMGTPFVSTTAGAKTGG